MSFYFSDFTADTWSGFKPAAKRSHIRAYSCSKPCAYCLQSNRGDVVRAVHTLCLVAFKLKNRQTLLIKMIVLTALNKGQMKLYEDFINFLKMFGRFWRVLESSVNVFRISSRFPQFLKNSESLPLKKNISIDHFQPSRHGWGLTNFVKL